MAGDCPFQQVDGEGCPGSLAETQAERDKRRLVETREKRGMRPLGTAVTRNRMIEGSAYITLKTGRRRTTDVSIQDDRNPFNPGPANGPSHRGNLSATEAAKNFHTGRRAVQFHRLRDN